jgi:hypothetical protein
MVVAPVQSAQYGSQYKLPQQNFGQTAMYGQSQAAHSQQPAMLGQQQQPSIFGQSSMAQPSPPAPLFGQPTQPYSTNPVGQQPQYGQAAPQMYGQPPTQQQGYY